MWNTPTLKELRRLPKLYETESVPGKEKIIKKHFYLGHCHWFAVEFDGQDTFFGYVILHGDLINAEWGYFSFQELKEVAVMGFEVVCDENWSAKPFSRVCFELPE